MITASLVLKEQRATSVDTSLVAFIDGSFKALSVNKISSGALGGIGGLVKYQNGKKVLEFLGPSSELNALDTEKLALSTLLQILQGHSWSHSSITIFSDCQLLVKESLQILNHFQSHNFAAVSIKYISRNFNKEADLLAKKGSFLKDLSVSWV